MPIACATAIATASRPDPELAAQVVQQALSRAGMEIAQSVLLFLSADFARHAQHAVHAASRAAHCLQIAGCTAQGLFTEEDWILDRPAACAMVLGGDVALAATPPSPMVPLLTLAVPAAATAPWLADGGQRYGAVAADDSAQHAGRVWGRGKLAEEGRFEGVLTGVRAAVGASQGLRLLTAPLAADRIDGYDVLRMGGQPALTSLLRELPLEVRQEKQLPLHLLFAGIVQGAAQGAVGDERYTLVPLIAVNHDEGSVSLATRLPPGACLFWAMRSALAAESDFRSLIGTLTARLQAPPDFALLFSCVGRGPYFFGGDERDLALLRERFPDMPVAGVYGSAEIGRFCGASRVLHNAAVLGLFSAGV